jgi:REP element-mobilizing transposase RayT
MEILSECDLLDDQNESDLDAYQRLAFGRLRLTEDDISCHVSSNKTEISISVRYRIIQNDHVQYIIELSPQSRPFITRYSELESFHRQMITRFPELSEQIAFPRKRFFGNFAASTLMKRTEQISCYITHLLNSKNFKYRNSNIFIDFFISKQRKAYRECLAEKNYEAALNYLYPIQDTLEKLEVTCSDHLVALSLICLCNAQARQEETALMYSQKTLLFVTTNARFLSNKIYAPLLTECVSIVARIRELNDPNNDSNATISKVQAKLHTCTVEARRNTSGVESRDEGDVVGDTFESIHNSVQVLSSTLAMQQSK